MWTSATAWQVTLFMGSSRARSPLITWLPTIETSYAVNPAAAGLHLFLSQVAGRIGGIGVTAFMRGAPTSGRSRPAISLLMILAMIGILAVPSLVVVLGVIASGLSTGSALVVALTLVAQRARTPRDAGRLSGMVQGVGYLIAAGGPAGAGLLFEATGAGPPRS